MAAMLHDILLLVYEFVQLQARPVDRARTFFYTLAPARGSAQLWLWFVVGGHVAFSFGVSMHAWFTLLASAQQPHKMCA